MAYGAVRYLEFDNNGCVTSPVPLASKWREIIGPCGASAGVRHLDAAPITDPGTQIDSDRYPIVRRSRATVLRLRLAYNKDATGVTGPTIKVFGRPIVVISGGSEVKQGDWQILENAIGQLSVPLTADPTYDTKDGTYKYTHPRRDQHWWEIEGFDEIIVGVEAVYTAGSDTIAFVQARMF